MSWLFDSDPRMPGPGFRVEIESSYHVGGDPAEYVECNRLRPDYVALNKAQLDYYYWFRDCVRNGKYIDTDRGYVWLLLCEIAVAEKDYDRGMKIVTGMLKAYKDVFPCNAIIADFAYDYATMHGFTFPDSRLVPNTNFGDALTCTRFAGPAFDLSMETIYNLGGYVDKTNTVDSSEYRELFNRSLEILDASQRSICGRGILEWYVRSKNEFIREVFEPYSCVGVSATCVIDCYSPQNSDEFAMFIGDLSRYCVKVLLSSDALKTPRIPRTCTAQMKAAVDTALIQMKNGEPRLAMERQPFKPLISIRSAKTGEKPRGIYFADDSAPCNDMTCYGEDYTNLEPMVIVDVCANDNKVSPNIIASLRMHMDDQPTGPVQYVPSKMTHPDPSLLSKEQIDYYVYWRARTLEKEFLDVDSGYMWMRLVELVNLGEDREETVIRLEELSNAYGKDPDDLVCRTAMEYAVAKNVQIPDTPSVDLPIWIQHNVYERLRKMPIEYLTPKMLDMLTTWQDQKYLETLDMDDFHSIVNIALRNLDYHMMESDGKRLIDMVSSVRPKTIHVEMFRNLYYQNADDRSIDFPMRDFTNCSDLRNYVSTVYKAVARFMRKRIGQTAPQIPGTFSEECRDIVSAAVNEWYNDRDAARESTRRSRMILDRDAVKSATEDLDVVKDLMYIEDGPMNVDTVNIRIDDTKDIQPEVTAKAGWAGLEDAFDDGQKAYLAAALDSPTAAKKAAKDNGSSIGRMESAINEIAMDVVGDVIVEDGKVIEDYEDDVRNLLS